METKNTPNAIKNDRRNQLTENELKMAAGGSGPEAGNDTTEEDLERLINYMLESADVRQIEKGMIR